MSPLTRKQAKEKYETLCARKREILDNNPQAAYGVFTRLNKLSLSDREELEKIENLIPRLLNVINYREC